MLELDSQLKLLACLKAIDVPIDAPSLDSRIVVQKKLYLIQALGCKSNYRFGWYLFGPYSQELSRDLMDLQSFKKYFEQSSSSYKLLNEERSAARHARSLFDEIKGLGNERHWLELISSIHFLVHNAMPRYNTPEDVFAKLNQEKPGKFSMDDTKKAWSVLGKYGLISDS